METYDKNITEWIPNYSSDGTNMTIPIASLPKLVGRAAVVHTTTGDIAELLFALLHQIQSVMASIPAAEQPVYFRQFASVAMNAVTDIKTRSYSTQFSTSAEGEAVLDEPA